MKRPESLKSGETISKHKKPQGVTISVVRTIWAIYKITPPMKKPPECLGRWRRGNSDWITGVTDSIMGVPGENLGRIVCVSSLMLWRAYAGREYRQDSEAVDESFWDGQGVEIEAKQFLRLRHGMTCRHAMAG